MTDVRQDFENLMAMVHQTANEAGWYIDPSTGKPIERNFGEVVALMHSELCEAQEVRMLHQMDDKLIDRDGFEVELADCIIRIMDTSEALGFNNLGRLVRCEDIGDPLPKSTDACLLRAHSELSFALESDRKSLGRENIHFARCCSIILEIADRHKFDLHSAIIEKNRYNRQRADHKLENRSSNGGNRY